MGVCDSKSMVVALDVLTEELSDECLVEICKAKSSGSSLLSLSSFGSCQVVSSQEVLRKAIDIAVFLGKSAGSLRKVGFTNSSH